MIEIRPLVPEDYRAAYEMQQWDCSFEHYLECLALPSYLNFGIHRGDYLAAVVSIERISATKARFHVAKFHGLINPREMAGMLGQIGDYLFANGFELVEVAIPPERRAASLLALRCGMREVGRAEDGDKIYRITKEERRRLLQGGNLGST